MMAAPNSTPETPRELSSAEEAQVQQWLAEAEQTAKTEDWDRTVALYRRALEFDRYLQGVEAKLQWAIRMRDTEKLYRDGKAKLDAGEYEAALAPLRKARLLYASHYKDVDELIVKAQTALQKEKWEKRPAARAAARKEKKAQNQRTILFAAGAVVLLALAFWFFFLRDSASGTPDLGKLPPVQGTPITSPSGLQIIEVKPGEGADARPGQTISVHYTGYLTNGTVFDSSFDRGQPYQFQLGAGRVIRGWDEGIDGMRVGGKRRLIIPPQLGYGAQGYPPDIPPNAVLVFDVELMDVK